MKNISITPSLEKDIVKFCDEELNYLINECLHGYIDSENEIKTLIEVLKLLGHTEMSLAYEKQYQDCVEENY